jgi:hypothetical protein
MHQRNGEDQEGWLKRTLISGQTQGCETYLGDSAHDLFRPGMATCFSIRADGCRLDCVEQDPGVIMSRLPQQA